MSWGGRRRELLIGGVVADTGGQEEGRKIIEVKGGRKEGKLDTSW